MNEPHPPYLTIRSRENRSDRTSLTSTDSAYHSGTGSDVTVPSTTHDISRVKYHVKHLDTFARTLEDSARRAFPNRGRPQHQQRYKKVIALLMHWKSDDLFVLPELEDLEKSFREDYGFETDTFSIPSENAHLELMMRIGSLIKDHEAEETLFIIYYGGHARIDESRQSTWCATRSPQSPWLQWSAIQTLLERSMSDTLILLDCCAGAASATFPNGKSITETISASSWDAIAPDPGRYSFTNALIEVLQEWRHRMFSAAMLHAEVLARLKHPRPIAINGKLFEARSTPVHFMMTANHRAPSIEIGRIMPPVRQTPTPAGEIGYGSYGQDQYGYAQDPYGHGQYASSFGPHGASQFAPQPVGITAGGRGPVPDVETTETVVGPNEDKPHVMISLALEDDQNLDLNAWEEWLSSFPALAKHVKVQGVFKSHSTLLLLSLPVMVWDLLPDSHACSFVAFIRSDNLIAEKKQSAPVTTAPSQEVDVPDDVSVTTPIPEHAEVDFEADSSGVSEYAGSIHGMRYDDDNVSVISGTTFSPNDGQGSSIRMSMASTAAPSIDDAMSIRHPSAHRSHRTYDHIPPVPSYPSSFARPPSLSKKKGYPSTQGSARFFKSSSSVPRPPPESTKRGTSDGGMAQHVVDRLEVYFKQDANPSVGITEFFASNLGVTKRDIDLWFYRRRQQELTTKNLQNLAMASQSDAENQEVNGACMIMAGQLNMLLDIFPPNNLLFIDLRAPTAFERSHIYGAINMRTPVAFIEECFDLVDKALDDNSRRGFARAVSSRCIVFYDRVIEFPWECPMANAVAKNLREKKGWKGEYFVLKGHYREFSVSFDKYIVGDRMTQNAKNYMDSARLRTTPTGPEQDQMEKAFSDWKGLVYQQNRMSLADSPANLEERQEAVIEHQAQLEAELQRRNPVLFNKAVGIGMPTLHRSHSEAALYTAGESRGSSARQGEKGYDKSYALDKEMRADLVEPLQRGLEKMHHGETGATGGGAGGAGAGAAGAGDGAVTPGGTTYTPGYDKYAEFADGASSAPSDEHYDSEGGGSFGRETSREVSREMGMGRGGSPSMNDAHKKSFWKRLRVNK